MVSNGPFKCELCLEVDRRPDAHPNEAHLVHNDPERFGPFIICDQCLLRHATSAVPPYRPQKDTIVTTDSSATSATSLSNPGITTTETETASIAKWQEQALAYRHAIKDVVREPDPIKLREALARLLSDDSIGTLGRDLHFIVKHAVRMVHFAELGDQKNTRESTTELFNKVKELEANATVNGWRSAT